MMCLRSSPTAPTATARCAGIRQPSDGRSAAATGSTAQEASCTSRSGLLSRAPWAADTSLSAKGASDGSARSRPSIPLQIWLRAPYDDVTGMVLPAAPQRDRLARHAVFPSRARADRRRSLQWRPLLNFDPRRLEPARASAAPLGAAPQAPLPIAAVRDPLARTCKTFRNRRPRSASNGQAAGQPTPIFRGRLHPTIIDSCLSRRQRRRLAACGAIGWRSRCGSGSAWRGSSRRPR